MGEKVQIEETTSRRGNFNPKKGLPLPRQLRKISGVADGKGTGGESGGRSVAGTSLVTGRECYVVERVVVLLSKHERK